MTAIEKGILDSVDALLAPYSTEMTERDIESFNIKLNHLLEETGFSLEEYHDLALEQTENIVNQSAD
jgi:hypothetical protein